ncbi:MAG: YdjY domain-containing protein [Aureliella sp.]
MRRYHWPMAKCLCLACVFVTLAHLATAQEPERYESRETRRERVEKTFADPPNMKRLAEKDRVWVDPRRHLVVVDGYVALRVGQLEMFACPAGTKEHESVVGVLAKAQFVHAALLAAGAKAGKPVQWEPNFVPPSGSEIEIHALWFDKAGKKHSIDARKWIKQFGTDKTLESNWVFAGSSFWKDPETGENRYMAESGDLVCISNFTTATLDVPFQSSQANSGLLFAANTDLIPPEGTPVRLVFKLVASPSDAQADATPPDAKSQPDKDAKDKATTDLLTPAK